MDKFRLILDIANKQSSLGCGLVALLTAGGEQIFSSAVFNCPCNNLNFVYGMVFLLVPALALLLLGYILNKKTWKLLTGLCQRRASLCRWNKLVAAFTVLWRISATALVAPCSWIAVALLNGKYYECLMTGANVTAYTAYLCTEKSSQVECQQQLHRFPCGTGIDASLSTVRNDVLLNLKAQSQILGWLLIASIMLSNLLLNCLARCTSPISYLQLQFWRAYSQEESNMFDTCIAEHAKQLAKRNTKSFFDQTPPEDITIPTNKDWEKVSSLYKFSTNNLHYSTLHKYVENIQETDGMMRMASVKSSGSAYNTPAVLDFVDGSGGAI